MLLEIAGCKKKTVTISNSCYQFPGANFSLILLPTRSVSVRRIEKACGELRIQSDEVHTVGPSLSLVLPQKNTGNSK